MHAKDGKMKVDKTYNEIFTSFSQALVVCTLIVSVGKFLTAYYFAFFIIGASVIILILSFHDYEQHRAHERTLELPRKMYSQRGRMNRKLIRRNAISYEDVAPKKKLLPFWN